MCTYCGVDGHTRDECLDRQEREIGTDRQLDAPLETCPDCGTANNRSVNDSCWRCDYDFVDRELVTDGGTATTGREQARLDVGDTRKPIVLKNARRVTTGDLSTLAMCAHRFDPSDVMGWYTHEFHDVLRQWICSNVGSVIARLSPHCEDTRDDLPPLHPADDLWTGSVSDGPTQATLEDTEGTQ